MRSQETPNQVMKEITAPANLGAAQRARRGRRLSARVALCLTLLMTLAASARAQGDSCPTDGVPVGMKGTMCAFGNFEINLAGVSADGFGFQCDGVRDETPKVWPRLVPDKTYTLTAGSAICVTTINFDVPDGYALFIDGKESNQIQKQDAEGRVFSGDGTWQVVLRKKCPCGEAEPATCSLGSVSWKASMGVLGDGRSAEHIGIREKNLSPAIYSPAPLIYSPPGLTNEVDVVRSGNGSLRQVKAPQMLADVVVVNSTEYEVRYYRPANVGAKVGGVYTLTGQPYQTWTIRNPDPTTVSRLQIVRSEGGTPKFKSEYAWDAAIDSWSLSTGWIAGSSPDRYTRLETKTVSYPTPTSRKETYTVKDTSGPVPQVVSKREKVYYTLPWGEELVQEVSDPDAAALTTTYAYYENASQEGAYRKLKSVARPDGSWEKYEYDAEGNKSVVLRPWKDVTLDEATITNSRATLYRYTFHNGYELFFYNKFLDGTEEHVEGKVVKATIITRWSAVNSVPITVNGHPVVLEEEAAYSSLAVQQRTTKTRYHASLRGFASAPDFLANRLASVEHPDGTKDTYSYEKGHYVPDAVNPALAQFTPDANGQGERTTVVHGTTAAPDGVAFKTTKETSVRDQFGNVVLKETFVYTGAGYERVGWRVSVYDDRGNLTQTTRHDGRVSTATWDGDRKTSESDESGVETVYTHDPLGRVKTQTKKGVAAGGGFAAQPDITTTFTYDAEGRAVRELVEGGTLSLSRAREYDRAGRLRSETDNAGLVTTYAYALGGRSVTVTRPGGATRITEKYLDGQEKSVTGTAAVAEYYDYGVDATTTTDGTPYAEVFVGSGGFSSPRWTKMATDWLGRTVRVEKPGFTGTNLVQLSTYNHKGQLKSGATTAGTNRLVSDTLYEYDELGNRVRTGSDLDAGGTLLPASADRMTETETTYEKSGNDWFLVATTRHYLTDNSAAATSESQRVRLTGFPASGPERTVSETVATDVAGNSTTSTTSVDRAAKKTTEKTNTPESDVDGTSTYVNGLLQKSTPATPEDATAFEYDALGRPVKVTSPRSGITTKDYYPTGQLKSVSEHNGGAAYTTEYEYYAGGHVSSGRLKSQKNAAGRKTYFGYNSRGELVQTWGDASYPLEYVYDAYGQRTELHTFRAGHNWGAAMWPAATTGAADVTRWVYQDATGLLTQKQDAALKGATYTYDEAGRLKTRRWARTDGLGNPLSSTYSYDPLTGELAGIDYSDVTPDVTFGYDRGGRQTNVTDAAGARVRGFNARGELQTEQATGGLLDQVQTQVNYDQYLRRQSLQAARGPTTLASQTYTYDPASRLSTISSGAQTATYTYHPTRGLLTGTTFTGGTSITRTHDALGRLESITNSPAAGAPRGHAYALNNLHQRTRATREDGSYWSYGYNDRGELESGKKYWADNTPVWGNQTEYGYDSIGNRKSAKSGGNELGGLRPSTYTTNALNQYTQRGVAGAVDVTGTAHAAATVSVNNQAAARKGEYFYRELAVNNAAGPASAQVNVVGARQNYGAGGEDAVSERGGRAFVPRAAESFTYDADGNLTSDGRWQYSWDAESRLVGMETIASVPAEAKARLEFSYDWMGRRIAKTVYAWNAAASTYQPQSVTKFVYDGWNVLAELGGDNSLLRSFSWGQSISGGDEAGEGGSLLSISEGGNTYLVGYDGAGNVTTLVKAGDGSVAASYDYDPFGNTLMSAGEYAASNPYRFSTKYTDAESGLAYYGFRYYNPQTGRWINRDPLGEEGGDNLYAFVENNALSNSDYLGLDVHDGEFKVVVKSYIARVGSNYGSFPGFRFSPNTRRRNAALAAFSLLVDKSFSEDPRGDAKDKGYRLYSAKIFRACCDGDQLVAFASTGLDTDSGKEGPIQAPALKVPEQWMDRHDAHSAHFRWAVTGTPHIVVEPAFQLLFPRSTREISHRVIGALYCWRGKPRIEVILSNLSTSFPSHRAFVNGEIKEERAQGPLSNLWFLDRK